MARPRARSRARSKARELFHRFVLGSVGGRGGEPVAVPGKVAETGKIPLAEPWQRRSAQNMIMRRDPGTPIAHYRDPYRKVVQGVAEAAKRATRGGRRNAEAHSAE